MDEGTEKRDRELRLSQAALSQRLREEEAAGPAPRDGTGELQSDMAIRLAKEDYHGIIGFDSPLSG